MTRLAKLRVDLLRQRQSIINIHWVASIRPRQLTQLEREFIGRRKRKINSLQQKIRSEIRREK